MIKMIFKPFFKRFIGLFLSMAFVAMLAIGLLTAFGTSMLNLHEKYGEYLDTYGYVDEQVTTGLVERSALKDVQNKVEGIEQVDVRLTLDMFIQHQVDEKKETLTARLFSYNENENEVFKRYIISSTDKNLEKNPNETYKYVNVGITSKFAKNNNITLETILDVGYADYHIPFFVNEIVETAEAIYPRANEYVWSDNQQFGYIYISEEEFGKGITNIANVVIDKIASKQTEEEKESTRNAVSSFLVAFGYPDILDPNLDPNYASKYGNQLITRNKAGYTEDTVMENILSSLENDGISVKKSIKGDLLPYRLYMENAQRQLTIGSIFLPLFFYGITMIIVSLFMNQIIKTMTPDIGVMMSIGVDKKDIIKIFLLFALLMGLVAGVFGVAIAFGINYLMTDIMIATYSIPVLTYALKPTVAMSAVGALVLFSELATFLSCFAIFKITPKDAVISNEAKRKKNPKIVDKIIDKSPMNIKLGLNSIFQNPKRFFVSIFSLFASFVLTMLCLNFYLAKNNMIEQSVGKRLNYDCQVYMTSLSEEEQINDIKSLEYVTAFEDCYYTYLSISANDKSFYVEALAFDPASTQGLIMIPDETGDGEIKISDTGIVIPKTEANRLGVTVGDTVRIAGNDVEIAGISYQYFHPIAYLSKTQMEVFKDTLTPKYVSSFLVSVTDPEAFSSYFVDQQIQCLTVFTNNLAKDLYSIFDAINIMIIIMVLFAFGIGFIILCIMSQNTLIEQKRPVSVLRLIGFSIKDVSNFWSLQSILQMLLALMFAIPSGIFLSKLLFSMASNATQIYPYIFSWGVLGISVGFVLLTVLITHSIAMFKVRKWNLADNTRSRE